MADLTCRFISNRGTADSPSASIGEEIYEGFILPIMEKSFPDFTPYFFGYDVEPATVGDEFPDSIDDIDLVIADLSGIPHAAVFELGMRHRAGRPTVFISEEGYEPLSKIEEFRVVYYRQDSSDSDRQLSEEQLVAAIKEALDSERHSPPSPPPPRQLPPRQARAQLTARILEAADALRLLRINSAMDTIVELENIAHELERVPEDKIVPALQATVEGFLKILARFNSQLASIRGSRMLISGLISVVLGGAGYSAVTVFAISLAFWEGKEAFLKAVELLAKKK
jgi:hypothetical protein